MSVPSNELTVWICRGWTENYAPEDAPHQWMHAYFEVPKGERCSICHATEDESRRWDGLSDPFASTESRFAWGWDEAPDVL